MKQPTIALAVEFKEGIPLLVEAIVDSKEITLLETCIDEGATCPLEKVYEHRQKQNREDDEFSDYVENLLCRPFLKAEIQRYGIQWLRSRIRIEKYQKDEAEAAKVIAHYAFEVFAGKPALRDFFLAGPKVQVRIRVFVLGEATSVAESA